MRTPGPDEQFLTSIKNGKLGVFREQSTRTQIVSLLVGDEDMWQTEYGSVGVGNAEMLFDDRQETLQRVNIKFGGWDGVQPWQKQLNLPWLDWLASMPFDSVFSVLDQAELPFRVVEFEDGCRGLLRVKLPATVMLVFDGIGTIDLLYVDFRNPFRELVLIRTLSSFHL